MKKQVLLLLALCSFFGAEAQEDHVVTEPGYRISKSARCPKVLIDLSTGYNNNGGLLGVGADYHFIPDVSVHGGVGIITTWGNKFYMGVKCHMRPCHQGWAFGAGVSYSTGKNEDVMEVATLSGHNEMVRFRFLPQTNVFGAAYRSWYVGRNRNRVYLQLGYSAPMTTKKYEQLSGTAPLTKDASRTVRSISPGGLIVGFGFSIGA